MEGFVYSRSFRDLLVYKRAFIAARRIFELSKGYPEEVKYALTSQIRRASRSIGAGAESFDIEDPLMLDW
jgi:23S rRNA-intervening sequence protein